MTPKYVRDLKPGDTFLGHPKLGYPVYRVVEHGVENKLFPMFDVLVEEVETGKRVHVSGAAFYRPVEKER